MPTEDQVVKRGVPQHCYCWVMIIMNNTNFKKNNKTADGGGTAKKSWKIIVDMDFFKRPGLSVYEKIVYTLLCGFSDADGASFPSAEKLAALAGCSARQVQRATASLEQRGLIAKQARYNDRGEQMSNLYHLTAGTYRANDAGSGEEKILPAAVTESPARHDRPSYKQTQDNINKKYTAASQLEQTRLPDAAPVPITAQEAPAALRVAAEYLLLKTGRSGFSLSELAALVRLSGTHVPSRIMAETAAAVERFIKKGRKLCQLTFCYIERALRSQKSLADRAGWTGWRDKRNKADTNIYWTTEPADPYDFRFRGFDNEF